MGLNNHKYLFTGLLVLFITLNSFESFSQFERLEQVSSFYSRIDNPVTIDVTSHQERIRFTAVNKSPFPYEIVIEFSTLQNLLPRITSKKFIVDQGRTQLFELTRQYSHLGIDFRYHLRTQIGNPGLAPDTIFPYLIPLVPDREISFIGVENWDTVNIVRNAFSVEPGEPVLNMRKGKVTAIHSAKAPGTFFYQEKVSHLSIVEVLHRDGTIAIYDGIDPAFLLVKTGEIVYPGQQLGLADEGSMITVRLYHLAEGGILRYLDMNFAINEKEAVLFNDLIDKKINHPATVIEREMNRRERRLFRSGSLY